ncbi:MAG: hypothetical protein ABIA78_03385 [archaeon]
MKRGLVLFILIFSLCFITATPQIELEEGAIVEQGNQVDYVIIITNTAPEPEANITQVNITLPISFQFATESQGTDVSDYDFSYSENTLSFTNSSGYLINGDEEKSFWFTVIPAINATYNITVTTVNSTTTLNTNILTIVSAPCNPNWNCTEWSSCIQGSQTRNCINLNDCPFLKNKPETSKSCDQACTPNWTCTEWSPCAGGIQIKNCIDFNLCGNDTTKPFEEQSCTSSDCTPVWKCTDWKPTKCPKNETQTKQCTDMNNCGTNQNKPNEQKTCTYESAASWLFILIVIIIIAAIASVILLIIRKFKNPSELNQIQTTPKTPPTIDSQQQKIINNTKPVQIKTPSQQLDKTKTSSKPL